MDKYLPGISIKGLVLSIKQSLRYKYLKRLGYNLSPKTNNLQQGFAIIPLVVLILFGIAAGTLLVQNRTNFLPKAAQNSDASVVPYIVYPADKDEIAGYTPAVTQALKDVQNFYKTKSGTSFQFKEPVIVKTKEDYQTLRCGGDSNCISNPRALNDSGNRVFIACNKATGQTPANTIKLIFCAGTGGYASGANNKTFADAMLGDWVLEPISGTKNNWGIFCRSDDNSATYCSKNAALGSIAHELGHAFGLEHPDNDPKRDASVMVNHTAYPIVGFLPQEIELLRDSPFLSIVGIAPAVGKCLLQQVRLPNEQKSNDVVIEAGQPREYCDVNNKKFLYSCEEGVVTPKALPDKDKECAPAAPEAPASKTQPGAVGNCKTPLASCTSPKVCKEDNLGVRWCVEPKWTEGGSCGDGCVVIGGLPKNPYPDNTDPNGCNEADKRVCPASEGKKCTVFNKKIGEKTYWYSACEKTTPAAQGPAAGAPRPATDAQAPGQRPTTGQQSRPATGTAPQQPAAPLICGKDRDGLDIPCYAIGVFSKEELTSREAQAKLASVNYAKFRKILDDEEAKIGQQVADQARKKIAAAEEAMKACLK